MQLKLFAAITAFLALTGCASLTYQATVEPEKIATGYRCDIKEKVSTTSGTTTYQLINLISEEVEEKSQCKAENFTQKAYMRYIFVDSISGQKEYGSQFAYRRENGSYGFMDNWIDLKAIYKDLEQDELINFAESLPYHYEDDVNTSDYAFWSKSYRNNANNEYIFLRNDGDTGLKRTVHNGSSSVEQCSSDGVTWSDC
ncbi:hypothetical protein [Reinekea sp.]|jgi:hypothetical protein|uniref:hypothetical protein n=1 Tax=Reinekea sp. TaxID=1970455 RepID=UPI0039894E31